MTTSEKLSTIRAEADKLGVKYHHRAGVDKIQGLINQHLILQLPQKTTPAPVTNSTPVPVQPKVPTIPVIPMTHKAFRARTASRTRMNASKLVRCRITNMNPLKKDWPGEIISVGSAKLGTFKKFVPFHSGEPYHLPQIIFDVLKDKKCSSFYNEENRLGHIARKSRLINEYALEVLPPLTPDELQELARTQAAAAGQGA